MMKLVSIALLILSLFATDVAAMKSAEPKTAIVIASFGTTYPKAVDALLAIVRDARERYPKTPARMAFTSNIIRKKWHGRAEDRNYREAHPEVPGSFYTIKNLLGTLADLQNEGYKTIVVQPTHLTNGEEFGDVQAYIDGLLSIRTLKEHWKPFDKIALGRPLMGKWGTDHPYSEDLERLADALKPDIERASAAQADLVYMGHGNEHLSTGLYSELEEIMIRRYPQVHTRIGLVEGQPDLDDIFGKLSDNPNSKLLLKPLMVVAGDHARNDMAGSEPVSWQSQLEAKGFKVEPVLEGLGDSAKVRAIFLDHLADAAKEAGIELH